MTKILGGDSHTISLLRDKEFLVSSYLPDIYIPPHSRGWTIAATSLMCDSLDNRLDKIRGDILQLRPFPTVEQAYAHVRREAICQTVMITDNENISGAVLATKGLRLGPINSTSNIHNGKQKSRASTEGLKCTHCGNQKHTRENCFKLHRYPDWWNDLQA